VSLSHFLSYPLPCYFLPHCSSLSPSPCSLPHLSHSLLFPHSPPSSPEIARSGWVATTCLTMKTQLSPSRSDAPFLTPSMI
jgi:hypothetical protein